MSHNEAWHFIRLGTRLERADKTTRMLDVKYFILLPSVSDVGTPYDDVQWSAVLKSVSGFEMYRKRYGRIAPERIVEFLLLDNEFPRAVRYCIGLADQALHVITGTPVGDFLLRHRTTLGLLQLGAGLCTAVEAILAGGLHEFCDALQTKMNTIDECILGDFFAQRPLAAARGRERIDDDLLPGNYSRGGPGWDCRYSRGGGQRMPGGQENRHLPRPGFCVFRDEFRPALATR